MEVVNKLQLFRIVYVFSAWFAVKQMIDLFLFLFLFIHIGLNFNFFKNVSIIELIMKIYNYHAFFKT